MKTNKIELKELSNKELSEIEGGWFMAVVAGVTLVGALAYGAGYVYGKLTCECE